MDYRVMTIFELNAEQAKIEAELSRRNIAFWQEAKVLLEERAPAAPSEGEKK